MKIRTRFVSNSSSSSFTCDICKHTESGWDMGLTEAEMLECVNGHLFCESHAKTKFNQIEPATIVGMARRGELYLSEKRKLELEEIEDDADAYDFIMLYSDIDDLRYSIPASMCPLCSFSSMRDDDLIKYLLRKLGRSRDDVVSEAAEQFGNYGKLKEYISEDKDSIHKQ